MKQVRVLFTALFTLLFASSTLFAAQQQQSPQSNMLRYGQLITINGRGVEKSNDVSTWQRVWTHANSPFWSGIRGHMELLVHSNATQFPVPAGSDLMILRKKGDPNSSSLIKYGDSVELWSMYAGKGHLEGALGTGRKWWLNTPGNLSWYWAEPNIMVGPNTDAWGMLNQQRPRPESGLEAFQILSAEGKKAGEPVLSTDIISLRTLDRYLGDHRYLWVYSPHRKWSSLKVNRLAVGGVGAGPDVWGIQNAGGDRSLSSLNQFNIQPAQRTQANVGQYDKTVVNTPLYLPNKTVVAFKMKGSGKYMRAVGAGFMHNAPNTQDRATHFFIEMQPQGWLGITPVDQAKTALTKTSGNRVGFAQVDFTQPTQHSAHWTFEGTLDDARFVCKASNEYMLNTGADILTLGTDYSKSARFQVEVLSRPVSKYSPKIVLKNAVYGAGSTWLDVKSALQKEIDRQGGSQIYIPAGNYSRLLTDPIPGTPKTLQFTYEKEKLLHAYAVNEANSLNLVLPPYTESEMSEMTEIQEEKARIAQRKANLDRVANRMFALKTPQGKYLKVSNETIMAIGTDLLDPAVILTGVVQNDTVAFKSDFAGGKVLQSEPGSPRDPRAFRAFFLSPDLIPSALWHIEGSGDKTYIKNSKSNGYLSVISGGNVVTGQLGQSARAGEWAQFTLVPLSAFEQSLAIARSQPNIQSRVIEMKKLINTIELYEDKVQFIKENEIMVNQRDPNNKTEVDLLRDLLLTTRHNLNFQTKKNEQGQIVAYAGFSGYIDEVLSFLDVARTGDLQIAFKQGKVAWLTDNKFQFTTPGRGMIAANIKAENSVYFCFHKSPTSRTVDEAGYTVKVGTDNNTKTQILKNGKVVYTFYSSSNTVTQQDQTNMEVNPQAMVEADGAFHRYWVNIDNGRISFGRDTPPGVSPIFEWTDPTPDREIRYVGVSCHKDGVVFQGLSIGSFVGAEKETMLYRLSQALQGSYPEQIKSLTGIAYDARIKPEDRKAFVDTLEKLVARRWDMTPQSQQELIRLIDRVGFLQEFSNDQVLKQQLNTLLSTARTQVTFSSIINQLAARINSTLALDKIDPARKQLIIDILELVNQREGKNAQEIRLLKDQLLLPIKYSTSATQQERIYADMMLESFELAGTRAISVLGLNGNYIMLTEKYYRPKAPDSILMTFKAQGAGDVTVALLPSFRQVAGSQTPFYEIVLGASNNTKTLIRRISQAAAVAEMTREKNEKAALIADDLPHDYWISYKDGKVSVGQGNQEGKDTILEWQDPQALSINAIGLGAGVSTVKYSELAVNLARTQPSVVTQKPQPPVSQPPVSQQTIVQPQPPTPQPQPKPQVSQPQIRSQVQQPRSYVRRDTIVPRYTRSQPGYQAQQYQRAQYRYPAYRGRVGRRRPRSYQYLQRRAATSRYR